MLKSEAERLQAYYDPYAEEDLFLSQRKDERRLNEKVGRQLDKARSNLNEKSIEKLAKKLHRAVAEVREERGSTWKSEDEKRLMKSRMHLLANPHMCIEVRDHALKEGWDGKPIGPIKLMEHDKTRQDHIAYETSSATSTYLELVHEILNGDERYVSIMTEFTITNKGW